MNLSNFNNLKGLKVGKIQWHSIVNQINPLKFVIIRFINRDSDFLNITSEFNRFSSLLSRQTLKIRKPY